LTVEVLEFDAGVGGCEVPIGFGVVFISIVLPRGDLVDEGLLVGYTAVETLRFCRMLKNAGCLAGREPAALSTLIICRPGADGGAGRGGL
jgi:hypothetical protein